jgi:hypothetical protein
MKTYEGLLKNKSEREWNGTMLYSFQLEGQNIWFRTGQKGITLDEGTPIKFQANETNKQVDLDSMEIVEKSSLQSSSTSTTSPSGNTSTTREDYWSNRERLDSVRTARADASRIVCAALAHDHLPHASNTPKGKRLDLLVGYVKEIAEELISYEEK